MGTIIKLALIYGILIPTRAKVFKSGFAAKSQNSFLNV